MKKFIVVALTGAVVAHGVESQIKDPGARHDVAAMVAVSSTAQTTGILGAVEITPETFNDRDLTERQQPVTFTVNWPT